MINFGICDKFAVVEIPGLNERQTEQIERQIASHACEDKYEMCVQLGDGVELSKFAMHPHVLRPMSSLFLARYIYSHPEIVRGKRVIDIGCGAGIQGIVAGLCGAKEVIMSDISRHAYENSLENIAHHELDQCCSVHCGDLFEKIPEIADVVIFAQPYFGGKPIRDMPVTIGMLDEGGLISRFLEEAKVHISPDGVILMIHLDWVGDVNDPAIQGPKHGYVVKAAEEEELSGNLQEGLVTVYELRLGGYDLDSASSAE